MDAGRHGAGAPIDRLSAATLSSGAVVVHVDGVRDGAHLDGLVRSMRAIPGVGGVRLRADGTVHSPVVVLTTTRPVAIASELRTGLGRQVVSCDLVDGRIELALEGAGPPRSRPSRARRDHRAVSDAGPGRPGPRARPTDHRPPPGLGARPVPGADRPPPAGPGDPGGPPPDAPEPESPRASAPPPSGAPGPPPPTADAVEEGLRRAIDAIDSLSVLTFDTELRFVRAAGAMHDRHDHRSSDLIGRRPIDIVGPEGWRTLAPGYEGALRGRTTTLETPSPDGRRRYEATFRPLQQGRLIVGGTVTLLDVTAVRRDERRLDELRDVFASAFDRSPIGQALLSPEAHWMRVNEPLRRILGRTDEQLVGAPLADATHPEDLETEERLLHAVRIGDEDGYDVEKRVLRPDGSTVEVHARMTAVRTREARLRGFIAHVGPRAGWAD